MKNVESVAEHREKLCQAFDALETYLQNTTHSASGNVECDEHSVLEAQIRDLTAANENLQQQLKRVTKECSELRMTCSKSVDKLNSLIDIVQSIVGQEEEDRKGD